MNCVWLTCFVLTYFTSSSAGEPAILRSITNKIKEKIKDNVCNMTCPPVNGPMQCGFDPKHNSYHMFPSECALKSYSDCKNIQLVNAALKYCINGQLYHARRLYGESCPSFCPDHYRPICGASKLRSYIYKTFTNGCYFDMLNCRGDDLSGYVEVPLQFCQRHLMKNIFKEQVVISNLNDYRDYHEY